MAYTKTTWIDGTTKLSAVNLNKIEDELSVLDTATSSSGWVQGLALDSNGKLCLYTKPQAISASVTVNNAYTSVYNTSYEINLSSAYTNRFSRAALLHIQNTDTAYEQLFAIIDLSGSGKITVIEPRATGNYKLIKVAKGAGTITVNFGTSYNIGGNVILSSGITNSNLFTWGIRFDDTAKKLYIDVAGVGGFGTHTIKFTAEAVFI